MIASLEYLGLVADVDSPALIDLLCCGGCFFFFLGVGLKNAFLLL